MKNKLNKKKARAFVVALIANLTVLVPTSQAMATPSLSTLDKVISSARERAMKRISIDANGAAFWNFPYTVGADYVSQYYLMRFWLGPQAQVTPFDEARFKRILTSSQLPDGSWISTPDPWRHHGDLSATIMNYWALKVMGEAITSPTMRSAQEFIIRNGGIEKSTTFAKIVLALFDNYAWDRFPPTPEFAVNPENPDPINIRAFAQWVRPHIVPMIYLINRRVSRDLGPRFRVDELWAGTKDRGELTPSNPIDKAELKKIVDQMLLTQQPLGSWGGYTSATLFTVIALADYATLDPLMAAKYQPNVQRGLDFVSQFYLREATGAYLGTVCDGRYWDSILVLQGVLNSYGQKGEPVVGLNQNVFKVAEFLTSVQVPSGGIPFGLEFASFPDTDDTAELINTLTQFPNGLFSEPTARAERWLLSMQNSDGGWGAFDRNNVGNPVLDIFAAPFKDSSTLFDPSTPDVTGHVIEALSRLGYNAHNSPAIQKAIQFLRRQADARGLWNGRWGVNYIYGTSAVISGLLRVGIEPNDPLIAKPLNWIETHFNTDHGFGETTASYNDASLAGVGVSTPTQTAWALLALTHGGRAHGLAAKNAARYLTDSFDPKTGWKDLSVVGTGHPGIIYLQYFSYTYAFTLMALSDFRAAF